ncbi:DUF11 domain-containing protein [Fibrella aquatilis]|uniref:DUF11 domain-containing protein n=1 Tax=Fibrella aquatilis TaxID=2817059 RepID=A0A939JYZ6_9BACT|nr:DUF11 domain-containing protein [Fibrella aquatilis]MBO0932619.1 DUF11 domain-containing protein [Fibrella aquatilis]
MDATRKNSAGKLLGLLATTCCRVFSYRTYLLLLSLLLPVAALFAQTGAYDVRFTQKSIDCAAGKVVIRVEVKARDANSTFLMGDANFRFTYPSQVLTSPRLVLQENFSSLAPASQPAYAPQDIANASTEGPTVGRVVLNTVYNGNAGAVRVGTNWVGVSCIEFTLRQLTTCFDLRWDTTFPSTGMNEVIVTGTQPYAYQLADVAANNYQNLNSCPDTFCGAPTNRYGVRLSVKNFDCVTKKAVIRVEVKATAPASGSFLMGDANYRFDYDASLLTNPVIVSQEHFSSAAPANDPRYTAQDLTGSAVAGAAGILSLNTKFAGTLQASQAAAATVGADWVTVSCIQFDYAGALNAACFPISWRTGTGPVPRTVMSQVTTPTAGQYSLIPILGTEYDNASVCPAQLCTPPTLSADLSLTQTGPNSSTLAQNTPASFTLVIRNDGPNAATNVVVNDTLPAGIQYVSASPGLTLVNGNVVQWTIASLPVGASLVATIQTQITGEGPLFLKAEIVKSDQPDPDSTPDNGILAEDDYATACVSVPIQLCDGDEYLIQAAPSLGAVQWFVDGVLVATAPTYTVTRPGTVSYQGAPGSCGGTGCCPAVFVRNPCCGPPKCVPFVIRKTR